MLFPNMVLLVSQDAEMTIWEYKFIGDSGFVHTIKAHDLDSALIEIRKLYPNKHLSFIKYLCY